MQPARRALPLLASLAFGARRASAQAAVVGSEPAAGAALPAGPARVWLRFDGRVDRARGRLSLHGPDGGQTPLPLESSGDPALLSARTDIVPWTPGAWRLRWQVPTPDGRTAQGEVPFTLGRR